MRIPGGTAAQHRDLAGVEVGEGDVAGEEGRHADFGRVAEELEKSNNSVVLSRNAKYTGPWQPMIDTLDVDPSLGDATTLEVTTEAPKPHLPSVVSLWYPVPKHQVEKFGDEWATNVDTIDVHSLDCRLC